MQNPVATIVLLMLLGLDVFGTLVDDALVYDVSAMRARAVYAVEDGAGWRLADPEQESFDELGQRLVDDPEHVVHVEASYLYDEAGAWASTHRTTGATATITPLGQHTLDDDDERVIRGLLADHLREDDLWGEDAEWLRYVDTIRNHTLVWGYVVNALSVAGILLLLYSLAWIPRTPAWIRATLAPRALARGRCPSCGYEITDLDRCPECGAHISRFTKA